MASDPEAVRKRKCAAAMKWNRANPERVKGYEKARFIRRLLTEQRLPHPHSIRRHGITHEELSGIVARVMASLQETPLFAPTQLSQMLQDAIQSEADGEVRV